MSIRRKPTFMILWGIISVVLMLAWSAPFGFALDASLEDAALKGNWQEVVQILEKDDKKADDPVARLIMAHACLATNRNNASLMLFLSVKDEGDLKAWSEWTDSLLSKHPSNPIALYLSADAKARRGRLEEAKEGFPQALKIKEDFALAYNALGVLYVLTNEWDNVETYFDLATKFAPDFADAYANLGTMAVLRESSLSQKEKEREEELAAFKKALSINPEFALVYNGIGCLYFGSGMFEEAAQYFSIASQLSPVLVVAEINQGFASAYASKLITLASMERKPGTTFETINQQYQETFKKQNEQLLKMLPTAKDQEFWKKIDIFQHLSNDQIGSLIKEHGLQKVQMGVFLKNREDMGKAMEYHQKTLALKNKVDLYNRWIIRTSVVDFTSSLIFSSSGLARSMQEGWKPLLREAGWELGKGGAEHLARSRTMEILIPGLLSDPISSTISSVCKGVRHVAEDLRYKAMMEQSRITEQCALLNTYIRVRDEKLNQFSSIYTTFPKKQQTSQIPGYYTSVDRPITEIGTLASMVDKGIKPTEGLPRTALIVSQDPFRTNLLQSELSKYRFQTMVVPPSVDPQIAGKQCGADVILGIREIEDPSKKYYDIKKLQPPFPPDKGGGAAGIPQIPPPIKYDWNWGKPFTPTYPKGAPGGISTEEIARSFVDKGNWPVMTTFSLFYKPAPSMQVQIQKEGE